MNMKPELFIHWKAKERSYIVGRTGRRVSPLVGGGGLGRVEACAGWGLVRPRPVAAERDWALPSGGSLPRLAGPSQPSVPVQSVSEEKTQARHLHAHHQDSPPFHAGDFIQELAFPTSLPALQPKGRWGRPWGQRTGCWLHLAGPGASPRQT